MVQPTPSPWCSCMHAKGMQVRWGTTQVGEPRMNRRVQKGGCTKVGVQKGDSVPLRVCKGEDVQAGWWANRRVGAPKWGCEREPGMGDSAPLHACKGGGCASRVACE